MTSIHHCSTIQNSFTALCFIYSPLPLPPQSLATTDLFTVSMVLSFPECLRVNIVQYVAFPSWLLSPSGVHWRLFCVFSRLGRSFFFSFFWVLVYCPDVPQSIYPFTYWKTSWFLPSFGNYQQSCYKYTYVGFLMELSFQLSWIHTKGTIAGSCDKSIFSFVRKCQTEPCLVWLTWLRVVPPRGRSPIWFLVRAHAEVCRPGSWLGHKQETTDWCVPLTSMFLSLSFSLPSPLSK